MSIASFAYHVDKVGALLRGEGKQLLFPRPPLPLPPPPHELPGVRPFTFKSKFSLTCDEIM